MIMSSRVRYAGHVAHTKEMRNAYKILVRKPEGKTTLEDLGVNGMIIFRARLRPTRGPDDGGSKHL
jgi:hypothetical protein